MTKHFDNKSAYKFNSDKNRKRRERRAIVIKGYPITIPFNKRDDVNKYFSTDKIVCLQCGKLYNMLNSHLKIHGMTVLAYQDYYQLPLSIGLVGAIFREKLADRANELRDKGIFNKTPPKEYAGYGGKEYKRPLFRKLEQIEHSKKMVSPKGENHPFSKLKEIDIKEIRNSNMLMRELAEKYNVSESNIQIILSGKTWKSLK